MNISRLPLLTALFLSALVSAAAQTLSPQFPDLPAEMQKRSPKELMSFLDSTYDANTAFRQKGYGYKQYGRWQWYWRNRIEADGTVPSQAKTIAAYDQAVAARKNDDPSVLNGTWTNVTPSEMTTSYIGNAAFGLGRINCAAVDPKNVNVIYVGTAGGGAWKTTDGGSTWKNLTETLGTLGIGSIAIDPTNSNVVYLGTGDAQGQYTRHYGGFSVGLMKSTNGGTTWAKTGLEYVIQQTATIGGVSIHPSQPSQIMVATNRGMFRSTNGGTTFTAIANGNFLNLVRMPDQPGTLLASTYGGSSVLIRSTDEGLTWQVVLSPPSGANRIDFAVAPSQASRVYAAVSLPNSTFGGLYASDDRGATFSLRASTPNLLGWSLNGADNVGAGFYALGITVARNNPNHVFVGGVNLWESTNGGSSWSINAHWAAQGGRQYLHADQHQLVTVSDGKIISVHDGGIDISTNNGASWQQKTVGLPITQFYRVAVSASNPLVITAGSQDNGTMMQRGGRWYNILGGDGMQTLVDPSNSDVVYASFQNGNLYRSLNAGMAFQEISPASNGDWITPLQFDPDNSRNLYAAYRAVYVSTNQGTSWSVLGNTSFPNNLTIMDVSKGSPKRVVVGDGFNLRGWNGSAWQTMQTPPVGSAITSIRFNPDNAQELWCTVSGYTGGSKVFRSLNFGQSWTNVTGSVANVPANHIAYNAVDKAWYLATDIGVYRRPTQAQDWQFINNGFPNVVCENIVVQPGSGDVYVATMGRGIWRYRSVAPVKPKATVAMAAQNICAGQSVAFTESSTNAPYSWTWRFPGGTPAVSNDRTPTVAYAAAGEYDVTLIVENEAGKDSVTVRNLVRVQQSPVADFVSSTGSFNGCTGDTVVLDAGEGFAQYEWSNGATTRRVSLTTTTLIRVIVTNQSGCKDTSANRYVRFSQYPDKPAIAGDAATGALSCEVANPTHRIQWYRNGEAIEGATDKTLQAVSAGNYTVRVSTNTGCEVESDVFGVTLSSTEEIAAGSMLFFPNPVRDIARLVVPESMGRVSQIDVVDPLGRVVYRFGAGDELQRSLDLSSLSAGHYTLRVFAAKGPVAIPFIKE